MTRRFGAWLVALAVWLLASAAQAQSTPPDRCSIVAALEDIPVEDRNFLRALCYRSGDASSDWRRSHPEESERLQRIVARSVHRADWLAVATLMSVHPRAFAWAPLSTHSYCERHPKECPVSVRDGSRPRTRDELQVSARRGGGPDEAANFQYTISSGIEKVANRRAAQMTDPGAVPASARRVVGIEAPEGTFAVFVSAGRNPQVLRSDYWLPIVVTERSRQADGRPATQATDVQTDDQRDAPASTGVIVGFVEYGAPYLVIVLPSDALLDPDSRSSALPRVAPVFHSGVAQGTRFIPSTTADPTVRSEGCIQLSMKSERPLLTLLDGIPVELEREGSLESGTLWVPLSRKRRVAHLTIVDRDSGRVLVQHSEPIDADTAATCRAVSFDLLRDVSESTVGLMNVEVTGCSAAGIDATKLRARARSVLSDAGFKLEDLQVWSHAVGYFTSLREVLQVGGAAAVGADRGRLDSGQSLLTGTAELLRRGFRKLLAVGIQCSRGEAGWEYSFSASAVDLEALQAGVRDPIAGLDVSGAARSEIELIADRQRLGGAIEGTLASLFHFPAVDIRNLPYEQPFYAPLEADVEVTAPPLESGKYLAILSARMLGTDEARRVCPALVDVASLRAERDDGPQPSTENFEKGSAVTLPGNVGRQRALLRLQQHQDARLLVRASLHGGEDFEKQLAVSYRCIDVRTNAHEIWLEASGWFPAKTVDAERSETGGSISIFASAEWRQATTWLHIAGGLGYSHTIRDGNAPPSWVALDSPDSFDVDGSFPYQIIENAVYLSLDIEARRSLCELGSKVGWCSSLTRRLNLTARLSLLPGIHIVDLGNVPAEYGDFGGSEQQVLGDVGGFVEGGIRVEVSRVVSYKAAVGFGSARWFDFILRDADDAAARRQLLTSLMVGLVWGF